MLSAFDGTGSPPPGEAENESDGRSPLLRLIAAIRQPKPSSPLPSMGREDRLKPSSGAGILPSS